MDFSIFIAIPLLLKELRLTFTLRPHQAAAVGNSNAHLSET